MLRGVWPPDVIPSRVWAAVDLYMMNERHGGLPEGGALHDQDAWTMAAWGILAGTLQAIRRAIDEERRSRQQG